jgi:hypothetical protein
MKLALATIATGVSLSASAQGTFQNLDFEEANPASDPNGSGGVTAATALPDWTVTVDGVQQNLVGYNFFAEGGATVTVAGPNNYLPPIDGDYSVALEGSFGTSGISQTGLVPVGDGITFSKSRCIKCSIYRDAWWTNPPASTLRISCQLHSFRCQHSPFHGRAD